MTESKQAGVAAVQSWLERFIADGSDPQLQFGFLTLTYIASRMRGHDVVLGEVPHVLQQNIGSAMRRMGWIKKMHREGGRQVWAYRHPTNYVGALRPSDWGLLT